MRAALLLVALAAPACSASVVTGSESAVLSEAAPETRLAVPEPARDRVIIDVAKVVNPQREGVSFDVSTIDGRGIDRISLYPADQPASFPLRLPDGTRELRVRLMPAKKQSLVRIELRVRAGPD